MARFAAGIVLTGICVAAVGSASARSWHSDDTAALVGGLFLGGVAAAASSHDHHHQNQVVTPRPAFGGAPFSPSAGVICYPNQVACYNNNGTYLPAWTSRVF
ncbi:hypothetical protein [Ensifer sp. MJa1]|uniref:hypothetical protein n=1 Tax=Ensifer sp. MJa1 TaxID=2919888 RepID=UPI00300B1B5C